MSFAEADADEARTHKKTCAFFSVFPDFFWAWRRHVRLSGIDRNIEPVHAQTHTHKWWSSLMLTNWMRSTCFVGTTYEIPRSLGYEFPTYVIALSAKYACIFRTSTVREPTRLSRSEVTNANGSVRAFHLTYLKIPPSIYDFLNNKLDRKIHSELLHSNAMRC